MVELCSAISGEVVAQLAVMEPEEQVVKELMRHLGWTTRTDCHQAGGENSKCGMPVVGSIFYS